LFMANPAWAMSNSAGCLFYNIFLGNFRLLTLYFAYN
jgi:hypothetical protein